MSYEIASKIKLNRNDNKIIVTSCSNNVKPRLYNEWEVNHVPEWWRKSNGYADESFDAKLHCLFDSLMSGDVQPSKTSSNKKILDALAKVKDKERELYGDSIYIFAEIVVKRQQLIDRGISFDGLNAEEINRLWWNSEHDFDAYQRDKFIIEQVCIKSLLSTFVSALGI